MRLMKHVVWYVYILKEVNYENGEASKVLLMQAVGPGSRMAEKSIKR